MPETNESYNLSTLEIIENPIDLNRLPAKPNSWFLKNITNGANPFFKSPTDLAIRIDEYFEFIEQEETKENPTLTGLSLFLGFCSRQSMYDYEVKMPVFAYIIKRARQIIEKWYETGLHDNKRVTGSIFALKQLGWYDNQKLEIGLENGIKAPRMTQDEINSIADQIRSKI